MKRVLVLGAGGFIGSHLVKKLKNEGNFVVGVDLKYPDFGVTETDKFYIGDLRLNYLVADIFDEFQYDEVYQLAADMGGAGFVFTGEHDADILHNNALINLNVAKAAVDFKAKKLFYSSSACIYPLETQLDPDNPNCKESMAYPANPDSDYGWEKLFSERMYQAWSRNYGLDVRIARFHNIFGPEGTYTGGREKAPAAICRKVAQAKEMETIEIWGSGVQTRSFLYIDECLEGISRLMNAPTAFEPLNIGSEEMVSILDLTDMVIEIAGKHLAVKSVAGPIGVPGRNSDNTLIRHCLGWEPRYSLYKGLEITYKWINEQVNGR